MWPFSSNGFDPLTDLPDLSGKVAVVTGGNAGLGYATIQHLVRHGAKVYMGARNEQKAKDAIARLDMGSTGGQVEWLELDLSDPRKAKWAAQEFLRKETRLDILVNNAAITLAPYTISQDDIQDVMMINYLSPFAFTTTLLPLLRQTALEDPTSDVRIVNVSAAAMAHAGPHARFRNREDFNDDHSSSLVPQFGRYGRSKLAGALFTNELQRRFDAECVPIVALSVHPGVVNTDGNQSFAKQQPWPLSSIFSWIGNQFTTEVSKGAHPQVFVAASPKIKENTEGYKGRYMVPPNHLKNFPNPAAVSPELAKELWETSVRLLEEMGVIIQV